MNTPATFSTLRVSMVVVPALLLAGCGEGEPDTRFTPIVSAPIVPPTPIPPVAAPGVPGCATTQPAVTECTPVEFQAYTTAGALADATASILIQPDTGGASFSYGGWYGELHSDQTGYFVTKPVPPATLTLRVFGKADYYLQPCAAIIRTPSAAVTQIELFSRAEALNSAEALRPSNATEPSLSGTVYEVTPDGRKPISDAYMMVGSGSTNPYWWFDEEGIAITRSSRDGHFYFCRLPPDIQIYVTRPGFVDVFVHPGVVAAGVPFDIELKRQGT